MSAFNVEQLQALGLMFLKLHAQGYNISMVFFGCYNLLIGYLIFRSTFLPRILGVLLAISGLCYQIGQFREHALPRIRGPSVPLHSGARRLGTIAGPVARRDGSERSTMERAGQRSGGIQPRMKAGRLNA
jgi:hypothetical protein